MSFILFFFCRKKVSQPIRPLRFVLEGEFAAESENCQDRSSHFFAEVRRLIDGLMFGGVVHMNGENVVQVQSLIQKPGCFSGSKHSSSKLKKLVWALYLVFDLSEDFCGSLTL